MIDQLKTQTPRYVAASAIVLVGLAFVIGGTVVGTGAVVGGVVATLDAWAITWLAKRIVTGAGVIGSGMAAGLLAVKLVLLLMVVAMASVSPTMMIVQRWGGTDATCIVGLRALHDAAGCTFRP